VDRTSGTAVAILIGVWATFALDVYSTLNSSPQTTELFAKDRQDSLMHWVLIGSAVAVGGGAVGAVISRRWWPLLATLVVAGGMYYCYAHAVRRGTCGSGQSADPPSAGWG
jgi:hypothetical protein